MSNVSDIIIRKRRINVPLGTSPETLSEINGNKWW